MVSSTLPAKQWLQLGVEPGDHKQDSLYVYTREPHVTIISCVTTRFVTQVVLLIMPTQYNTNTLKACLHYEPG